jgi:hypothetical protein
MAGGDLSEATLVSERYLLDLRLSCLYVLKEKHWKESNMLTKGKPLKLKPLTPNGELESKFEIF